MTKQQLEMTLSDALVELEQCLETPVIPGELPQWCQMAKNACRNVDSRLRRAIAEEHPDMFQRIRREDAELASRVDSLQKQDEELIKLLEHTNTFFERLTPAADAVEPDENRIEDHVESAVDQGLQLVIAVRKQETAITTWYMEALERDRGTAD